MHITAIGYGGGEFIWNPFDSSWDFVDYVDTSDPRYDASSSDMDAATEAAEGTLLHNISISQF